MLMAKNRNAGGGQQTVTQLNVNILQESESLKSPSPTDGKSE